MGAGRRSPLEEASVSPDAEAGSGSGGHAALRRIGRQLMPSSEPLLAATKFTPCLTPTTSKR
jgi:hypothetical protein